MSDILELAYALQIPYSRENPDFDSIKWSIQQLSNDTKLKDRKEWRRTLQLFC